MKIDTFDAKTLAALDPAKQTEVLLGVARNAGPWVREGKMGAVANVLAILRESSAYAAGEQLFLLELAEGFLRTLAPETLEPAQVALHRFFERDPIAGHWLVQHALDSVNGLSNEALARLSESQREAFMDLLRKGVLRQEPDGLRFHPALRNLARELDEPRILRFWNSVERARSDAAANPPNASETAIDILIDALHVTREQAIAHLTRHPLIGSGKVPFANAPPTAKRPSNPGTSMPPKPTNNVTTMMNRRNTARHQNKGVRPSIVGGNMANAITVLPENDTPRPTTVVQVLSATNTVNR
jgi:hypothetical protein